jgi:hypothetical protein
MGAYTYAVGINFPEDRGMTRFGATLGLIAILLAAQGWARGATDFSGTWVLNTKKGENLGMIAAVQETLLIAQTENEMKIDFTDVFQGNTTTRQVIYDLSGDPVENFAAMGDRSETISKWIGEDLVTTWTSEGAIAGTTVVRTEIRKLAEDGQVMTVSTARGDRPARVLVYEKE